MDVKTALKDIFHYAVEAVNPYHSVKSYLESHHSLWKRGINIVGFGKAVSGMAMACEDVIGDKIAGGTLITKYGHAEALTKLDVKEAGHPVPDANSLKYTQDLIDFVRVLPAEDDLICLISGGGSALFCKPYAGLSLNDKQKTTDILLRAGADIFELNTVRKHLSDIKGGRFLQYFNGRCMTSLILSDVLGDRLDVIASGATTYDESTYQESLDVIQKYDLNQGIPENVLAFLKNGCRGIVPETVKYGDPILDRVENIIIGSLNTALRAAGERAEFLGMEVIIPKGFVTGEAVEAGKDIGRKVLEIKKERNRRPLCIISGGETTVTVKGNGSGGRNMELALAFAQYMSGQEGIAMLSAGTDGGDGPTDAAGAIVNGATTRRAENMGLNVEEYLSNNDTYNYFRKTDELFITGATGTNVMDIQIVIIQ